MPRPHRRPPSRREEQWLRPPAIQPSADFSGDFKRVSTGSLQFNGVQAPTVSTSEAAAAVVGSVGMVPAIQDSPRAHPLLSNRGSSTPSDAGGRWGLTVRRHRRGEHLVWKPGYRGRRRRRAQGAVAEEPAWKVGFSNRVLRRIQKAPQKSINRGFKRVLGIHTR